MPLTPRGPFVGLVGGFRRCSLDVAACLGVELLVAEARRGQAWSGDEVRCVKRLLADPGVFQFVLTRSEVLTTGNLLLAVSVLHLNQPLVSGVHDVVVFELLLITQIQPIDIVRLLRTVYHSIGVQDRVRQRRLQQLLRVDGAEVDSGVALEVPSHLLDILFTHVRVYRCFLGEGPQYRSVVIIVFVPLGVQSRTALRSELLQSQADV